MFNFPKITFLKTISSPYDCMEVNSWLSISVVYLFNNHLLDACYMLLSDI